MSIWAETYILLTASVGILPMAILLSRWMARIEKEGKRRQQQGTRQENRWRIFAGFRIQTWGLFLLKTTQAYHPSWMGSVKAPGTVQPLSRGAATKRSGSGRSPKPRAGLKPARLNDRLSYPE
jgi:hypothetical protein